MHSFKSWKELNRDTRTVVSCMAPKWGGALKSRDLTTRHQIKLMATGWTSVGPRKNWTCWTINELNPVCHASTTALRPVACSFCVQSAILSALIRSPYSRGSTTEATATAARTKTWTGMALAVPAAPTATTISDNCYEVCIVAPRPGFELVPCGHKTRRQYTRRRNDDTDLSVNHTINHYFIVCTDVVQRAGQLILPHVAISKTVRTRNRHKTDEQFI